jgi:hypothetical protein
MPTQLPVTGSKGPIQRDPGSPVHVIAVEKNSEPVILSPSSPGHPRAPLEASSTMHFFASASPERPTRKQSQSPMSRQVSVALSVQRPAELPRVIPQTQADLVSAFSGNRGVRPQTAPLPNSPPQETVVPSGVRTPRLPSDNE